jgi:hypothetical protein
MNEIEGSGLLPEMENIICQLERGTVVTKFFQKKHPDRRILSVKRETRQVVWCKPMSKRNVYEGAGKILFYCVTNYAYMVFKVKTLVWYQQRVSMCSSKFSIHPCLTYN